MSHQHNETCQFQDGDDDFESQNRIARHRYRTNQGDYLIKLQKGKIHVQ